MTPLLVLLSAAFAADLNLLVAPSEGTAMAFDFVGMEPGVPRVVNAPCAEAKDCRVTVAVFAEPGGAWKISVRVEERRDRWFRKPTYELVVAPTFLVPQGETAQLIAGSRIPVLDEEGGFVAFRVVSLHITAAVVADAG